MPFAEREPGDVAAVEVQEVADPQIAPDQLAVQEHGGGAEGLAQLPQRRCLDLGTVGVGDPHAPPPSTRTITRRPPQLDW